MMYSSRLIKAKKIIQKPKMTCIIGRVCEDGIVLIADRKVTYDNGNINSEEKIFCDYSPFVVCSSGYNAPFRNFRREALSTAQTSRGIFQEAQNFQKEQFDYRNVSGITSQYPIKTVFPIIHLYSYIESLKKIVDKYNKESKDQKYHFDVLIATQRYEAGASLHFIDSNGTLSDIPDQIIIGTGENYASFFLKPFLKRRFTMESFAELGFFVIKYIDRFGIDDKVGLLGELPLVWFIPHSGTICKVEEKNLLEKWNHRTDKMLYNFENYGIEKLLD